MARRTLTDTERAERNARITALAAAAEHLEQNHTADIDTAARVLSHYSRRNVALILVQASERGRDLPAAVAGFHDWRKAGRVVRKGAKGYAIYAPVIRKDKDTGQEEKKGYSIRYVFDIADTDPIAGDSPATLAALNAGG